MWLTFAGNNHRNPLRTIREQNYGFYGQFRQGSLLNLQQVNSFPPISGTTGHLISHHRLRNVQL